jgi:hypothetical protein
MALKSAVPRLSPPLPWPIASLPATLHCLSMRSCLMLATTSCERPMFWNPQPASIVFQHFSAWFRSEPILFANRLEFVFMSTRVIQKTGALALSANRTTAQGQFVPRLPQHAIIQDADSRRKREQNSREKFKAKCESRTYDFVKIQIQPWQSAIGSAAYSEISAPCALMYFK